MTFRPSRMAPPISRARAETSPMQPPMFPRSMSAGEAAGRAGITMSWRGVAALTTSAVEPKRGSSAPAGA